jgi:Zn-finger nucleic acid-binding protein
MKRTAVLALVCALIGVAIMSLVSSATARGMANVQGQLEKMSAVDLRPLHIFEKQFVPEEWRNLIADGDIVLVCDVGGGTADFSLIAVTDVEGRLELERVSVSAPAATTLHSIWQIPPGNVQPTEARLCPRCPEQELKRSWYSDRKQVEIDRCPKCGGIWLDAGEFTSIYEEVKAARETSPLWLAALEVIATHKDQPAPSDRGRGV